MWWSSRTIVNDIITSTDICCCLTSKSLQQRLFKSKIKNNKVCYTRGAEKCAVKYISVFSIYNICSLCKA